MNMSLYTGQPSLTWSKSEKCWHFHSKAQEPVSFFGIRKQQVKPVAVRARTHREGAMRHWSSSTSSKTEVVLLPVEAFGKMVENNL